MSRPNAHLTVIGIPGAWAMYRPAPAQIRQAAAELAARVLTQIGEEIDAIEQMTFPERQTAAREAALILQERGDVLMFTDQAEAEIQALTRLIAILAGQLGGIDWAAHHWCRHHRFCGIRIFGRKEAA